MADDKNVVEEFLKKNGKDELPEDKPFADVTLEPKVDEQLNKEEIPEEKPLPFHKDPKVQRYIKKEVEKLTQGMTAGQKEEFKEKVENRPDLVAAFTKIIGNDTQEKVDALRLLGQTVADLEAKAGSAIAEREAERKAEREAEDELETGFENVEVNFNVDITSDAPQAKKTRSEFIDFIKRVAPKNQDGEIVAYPDFEETFSLFQEFQKKTAPANRAKELSGRSMERGGEAPANPLPADQSWKGVEKHFATLKG